MAAVVTEQFLSLRSPRIAVTFNPVLPLSPPTPGPKDSSIQDCIHVILGSPVSEFTSWQCSALLDPVLFTAEWFILFTHQTRTDPALTPLAAVAGAPGNVCTRVCG